MSVFMLEGKLVNCHRTPEGVEAVSSGKVQLDARQRQFWLVVDKTDSLNQSICEMLAEKINIKAFIDAGLLAIESSIGLGKACDAKNIEINEAVTLETLYHEGMDNTATAIFDDEEQSGVASSEEALFVNQEAVHDDLYVSEIDALPMSVRFDWVKSTMCSSAEKTSGLLAANLIANIEQAQEVGEVLSYIAPWKMTMLDSNYPRAEVELWLKEVKYALKTIS